MPKLAKRPSVDSATSESTDPATELGQGLVVRIRLSEATDRESWNAYVDRAGGRGFCDFGWADVLKKSYGVESHFFLAESAAGEIHGILPCYVNKTPRGHRQLFGIRRGLLVDDPDAGQELLTVASEYATKNNVRSFLISSESELETPLASEVRKSVVLRLREDEAKTWDALRRETRVGVKRSRKHGTTFEWGEQNLEAFYDIYAENMLSKNVPIFSLRYFHSMFEYLGERVGLIVVRYQGQIIAGMVVLWSATAVDLYIGAWLRAFAKQVPYQRMYWEAIAEAQLRGLSWVDMGESAEGSGTYKFKINFGGEPQNVYYFGPMTPSDDELGPSPVRGTSTLAKAVGFVYDVADRSPRPLKKRISIWRRAHGRLV